MGKPKAFRGALLSPAALHDIRDILLWSLDNFGVDAAARYRALLMRALKDLEADPQRPGSRARPELAENARTYHLALSRSSVQDKRLKTPRHFILYRATPTRLEVARIPHDSRDLPRHFPADYL